MCAGFDGGTAICITFFTNGVGLEAAPADTTWSMFFVLADANTSAGAPCVICCASPELGPKLNTTLTPLCAFSNSSPSTVNASVRDAAANTLTVPANDADDSRDAAGRAGC